jgi:hypothetical protein
MVVYAGASRTKLTALVLLGLGIVFYLMFAVGEMAGGDVSGIEHVPPAVILAVLFWAAWKHPLMAGIVLLALAVPLAIAYVVVLVVNDLPLTWALWIALPPVLTGFFLVRAGRQERSSR